ncbi:MAG: hypothetical protein ACKV2T_21880 [Kofleriaceae bacterium]
MKRVGIMLALVAACGPDKDYSGKKLVEHTVTAEGVTYAVMIPEGLPKSKHDPGDWSDARVEYDFVPHVFTGPYPLDMPETEEKAKRDVPLSPEKGEVVRAVKSADQSRWSITLTDGKKRIEASSLTKVGDKLVKCHAVQTGDGDIDNFDKTRVMLEAVCDSIKAR